MGLHAILTVGWPEDRGAPLLSAAGLTERCGVDAPQFQERLLAALTEAAPSAPGAPTVTACDRMFRRRSRGFRRIQAFLAALNAIVQRHPGLPSVRCEMDAFAYAFLRGAKNIDFFLPEQRDVDGGDPDLLRNHITEHRRQIRALERFERRGSRSGLTDSESASYRELRRIVARPSARDERRALAVLLVSGPSTIVQISEDLGLSYTLGSRILPTMEGIGVLHCRDGQYVIRTDALPRSVFLLRETLGIDLLEVLDE
jgi:hypothetical protein